MRRERRDQLLYRFKDWAFDTGYDDNVDARKRSLVRLLAAFGEGLVSIYIHGFLTICSFAFWPRRRRMLSGS